MIVERDLIEVLVRLRRIELEADLLVDRGEPHVYARLAFKARTAQLTLTREIGLLRRGAVMSVLAGEAHQAFKLSLLDVSKPLDEAVVEAALARIWPVRMRGGEQGKLIEIGSRRARGGKSA